MKWNDTYINRTRFIPYLLSLLLLMSLFHVPSDNVVKANSTREDVIESMSGSVTITKEGGSREVQGYEGMRLQKGDHLRTGSHSSVVLNIIDKEDTITISSNSEMYLSDLSDDENKKVKLKSWAGTTNLHVNSLLETENVFEIETPTSDMQVRGTHFTTYVDPVTGDTMIYVHSGIVNSRSNREEGESESDDSDGSDDIYAGLGSYLPGNQEQDSPPPIYFANPEDMASLTNEDIIRALLESRDAIQQENEEMLQQIRDHLSDQGYISDDGWENYRSNLDNLISNIVRQSVENNPDLSDVIDQFNRFNPDRSVDLDNTPPYEAISSERANQERARLEEMQGRREQQLEEQRRQREQSEAQNRDLLDQLNERNQQVREQNEEIEAQRRRQAEDRYLASLTETERERFEQELERRKQSREDSHSQTRPTDPPTPESEPDDNQEQEDPQGQDSRDDQSSTRPTSPRASEAERDENQQEHDSGGQGLEDNKRPSRPTRPPVSQPDPDPVIEKIESITTMLVLGDTYSLPTTVEAIFDDGTTESIAVTWLDELDLTKVGTQTLRGSVEDYEGDVSLTVEIEAPPPVIVSVESIRATIVLGDSYSLPTTVKAIFDDGTTESIAVMWLDELDLTKVGTQTLRGSVEDYEGDVSLTIEIEAPPPVIESVESIRATIVLGDSYSLPTTVKAIFDDGTTESIAVTWLDELDLTKVGTQTLRGSVEDYEGDVSLTIEIEAPPPVIESVESIRATIVLGDSYSLPTTVKAIFDDGTTESIAVTWLDELDLTKVGTQTLRGSVEDYEGDVSLTVEIEAPPPVIESVESITAIIVLGDTYSLPPKLKAIFDDGTTELVSVTWLEELDLTKVGTQTLRGSVEDYEGDASLTVHIEAPPMIEIVEPLVVAVELGEPYSLPKTVDAVYDDGTTKAVTVTWLDELDLTRTGTQILNGTVEDYEGEISLTVHVEAPLDTFIDVLIEDDRPQEIRFSGGVVLDLGKPSYIEDGLQIKVSKSANESPEAMTSISTIYEIILGVEGEEYHGEMPSGEEGIILSIPIDSSNELENYDDVGIFQHMWMDEWEYQQTDINEGIASVRLNYLFPFNTFGVFEVEPVNTPTFEAIGRGPRKSVFVDHNARLKMSTEPNDLPITWIDLAYPSDIQYYYPNHKPSLFFRPGGMTVQAYTEYLGRQSDWVTETYHMVEVSSDGISGEGPARFELNFTDDVSFMVKETVEDGDDLSVVVNFLGSQYYMRVIQVADEEDEADTVVAISDVVDLEEHSQTLEIVLTNKLSDGNYQVEFYRDEAFTQYQANSNVFQLTK